MRCSEVWAASRVRGVLQCHGVLMSSWCQAGGAPALAANAPLIVRRVTKIPHSCRRDLTSWPDLAAPLVVGGGLVRPIDQPLHATCTTSPLPAPSCQLTSPTLPTATEEITIKDEVRQRGPTAVLTLVTLTLSPCPIPVHSIPQLSHPSHPPSTPTHDHPSTPPLSTVD